MIGSRLLTKNLMQLSSIDQSDIQGMVYRQPRRVTRSIHRIVDATLIELRVSDQLRLSACRHVREGNDRGEIGDT
jgi:hypothetical protein